MFKISYILKIDILKIILEKIKISTINFYILKFNSIFENLKKSMTMTKSIKLCLCKGIKGILNDKSAFLRSQLSLKSKT